MMVELLILLLVSIGQVESFERLKNDKNAYESELFLHNISFQDEFFTFELR